MSQTVEVLKARIQEQAERRDATLRETALQRAAAKKINKPQYTPSKSATRIKGESLLKKNLDEERWPGERSHFDIDRDQILFNPNFIRLARKTQVFIGQRNVAFRSRLIHTLEVSQVARGIALEWGLNSDLIEAICLGHDIGQTPFGHSGEMALNACLYEYFIRKYCLDKQEDPATSTSIETGSTAHWDVALFNTIELLLDRHSLEAKSQKEIKEMLSEETYEILRKNHIIEEHTSDGVLTCSLALPRQWILIKGGENKLDELWIQDDDSFLFAHFVHSVRVLLEDQSRSKSDITTHVAYGILAHSWRGAPKEVHFTSKSDHDINLSSDQHETPEAFVVRVADDICFVNSDLNDMDHAGLVPWDDLRGKNEKECLWNLTGIAKPHDAKYPFSSAILNYLEKGFDFKQEFDRSNPKRCYGDTQWRQIQEAKAVISRRLHPLLQPRRRTAKRIIRDLFWLLLRSSATARNVEELAISKYHAYSKVFHGETNDLSDLRKVTDYLAYLTDDEATAIHSALFAPEQDRWAAYFYDVRYD